MNLFQAGLPRRAERLLVHVAVACLAGVLVVTCLPSPGSGAGGAMTVGVKHNILATLVVPDGPGPFPGVLILSTSGGVVNADIAYARRLAGEGFVCLVPAYIEAYHLVGPHGPINPGDAFTVYAQQIHDDLIQSVDVLRHQEKANGKIGAVGFSAGGYFAVWLALTQEIQAGVSYYGSFQGASVRIARLKGLATEQSSPLLILHGDADRTVPIELARSVIGILDEAKSPYESQIYPGAGHGFDRGGEGPLVPSAAADAWARTLVFLTKYLNANK